MLLGFEPTFEEMFRYFAHVAVNQDVDYSLVAYGDKKFYIASDTIERVMTDEKHQPLEYSVIKTIKGAAWNCMCIYTEITF